MEIKGKKPLSRLPCPGKNCMGYLVLRKSRRGPFWGCVCFPMCDVRHGAHPDGSPMGVPAEKQVRQARIKAHLALDNLFGEESSKGARIKVRGRLYKWLGNKMGIPVEEAHIGKFNEQQCQEVIRLVQEFKDLNG